MKMPMDTNREESVSARAGPPSVSPRLGSTVIRLVPATERTAPSALDTLKEVVADVESGKLLLTSFILCMTVDHHNDTKEWFNYRVGGDLNTLEAIGLISCIRHDLEAPGGE